MKKFLAVIDGISEWSGKIASFLIVFMTAILLYEVAMRFVFNAPTYWAHELTLHLFGFLAVLSGAYVLRHDQHVRIDIIYNFFPPRGKAILDAITYVIFFLYVGVLVWHGTAIALWSIKLQQTVSPSPWGSPLWPTKAVIPVAALFLFLQGIAQFIRSLTLAVTGKELQ
ncbi:MAG TPA: TRAP transporter small permease subunit [Desulfotignum sp.]|nr:TRAP transporter small permease subunit [Desulfotignum sp.]